MKKINVSYVSKWYIGGIVLSLLIGGVPVILIRIINSTLAAILITVSLGLFVGTFSLVPRILGSVMNKKALVFEKGFKHDYKFTAHNAVFYFDSDGRLGVVWRGNPFEIQLANLSGLTDIRTHDGKMLGGTSLVSCRFKLDGKSYRIDTLRVYRGVLAMAAPSVVEAIAKADKLCELLNAVKSASGVTN